MDKFITDTEEMMLDGFNIKGSPLETLLNALRDSITIMNDQGEVIFWNAASEKLLGYSQEDATGKSLLSLFTSDDQSDHRLDKDFGLFFAERADDMEKVIQMKVKHKAGKLIDIEISLSKLRVKSTLYTVGVARDISDSRKIQRELENTRKEYLELAEKSPIGIVSCDQNGNIIYINQMALNILGSPNIEETKKINLLSFPPIVESGFSERLKESIQNETHIRYEVGYESKWGKKVWLRIHIKPYSYDASAGAQIIIDDITERKNLENELFIYSYTDALTGTYNRRYLLEKLEKELANTSKSNGIFSLIMIDLDHFKNINDRFGHNIGDFVLKTTSSVFIESIRRNDILARWGGEEFIILLPKTAMDQAVQIAEKLRKNLVMTAHADVGNITASFGVTSYWSGDTEESIIQRADNLLYTAKLSGRNCISY